MQITGLYIIPTTPGAAPVTPFLTSRISQLYPTQQHQPWHVDHRLFVSTSSLLPGSDPKLRHFTHILSTSHNADTTFIGTLDSPAGGIAVISIPSSSRESFNQLMLAKLQPQWAHRQSIVLDGTSIGLPIDVDAQWAIRIGEMKLAGGMGRSGVSGAVGTARGVLVEIQYNASGDDDMDLSQGDNRAKYEALFSSLLHGLFADSVDIKPSDMKPMLKRTNQSSGCDAEKQNEKQKELLGRRLAELYMDVLRR